MAFIDIQDLHYTYDNGFEAVSGTRGLSHGRLYAGYDGSVR